MLQPTDLPIYVAALQHEEELVADETRQAELIDGKAIAQTIRKEVAAEVTKLREKYGKVLLCCTSLTICLASALQVQVICLVIDC